MSIASYLKTYKNAAIFTGAASVAVGAIAAFSLPEFSLPIVATYASYAALSAGALGVSARYVTRSNDKHEKHLKEGKEIKSSDGEALVAIGSVIVSIFGAGSLAVTADFACHAFTGRLKNSFENAAFETSQWENVKVGERLNFSVPLDAKNTFPITAVVTAREQRLYAQTGYKQTTGPIKLQTCLTFTAAASRTEVSRFKPQSLQDCLSRDLTADETSRLIAREP